MTCTLIHNGNEFSTDNFRDVVQPLYSNVVNLIKNNDLIQYSIKDDKYFTKADYKTASSIASTINNKYSTTIVKIEQVLKGKEAITEFSVDVSLESQLIINSRLDKLLDEYGLKPDAKQTEEQKEVARQERLDLQTANAQISVLQRAFPNAKVIFDSTLPVKGRVLGTETAQYKEEVKKGNIKPGQPAILVNPDTMTSDTIIHEFGHIYIDMIGGMQNEFVVSAINQLKDTPLWKEVSEAYPELKEEDLGIEVLITAIGLEGEKAFKTTSTNRTYASIARIIDRILKAISELTGLSINQARILAREMLSNDLRTLKGQLKETSQDSRSFTTKAGVKRVLTESQRFIRLDEDNHIYFTSPSLETIYENGTSNGVQIIEPNEPSDSSVTQLIKDNEFDVDTVARNIAMFRLGYGNNYFKLTEPLQQKVDKEVQRIIDVEWKGKADAGTALHKLAEDIINSRANPDSAIYKNEQDFVNTHSKLAWARKFYKAISNLEKSYPAGTEFMSEVMVHHKNITTTTSSIDLIAILPNGEVDIIDFKTSTKGVYKEGTTTLTNSYKTFKLPQHGKQMAGYAAMLTNLGIKVRNTKILPIKISMDSNTNTITGFEMGNPINTRSFKESNKWTRIMEKRLPSGQFLGLSPVEIVKLQNQILADNKDLKKVIDSLVNSLNAEITSLEVIDKANPRLAKLKEIANDLLLRRDEQAILSYIAAMSEHMLEINLLITNIVDANPNGMTQEDAKKVSAALSELKTHELLIKSIVHHNIFNDALGKSNKAVVLLAGNMSNIKNGLVELSKIYTTNLVAKKMPHLGDFKLRQEFEATFEESLEKNNGVLPLHIIQTLGLEPSLYAGKKIEGKEKIRFKQLYAQVRINANPEIALALRRESVREYVENMENLSSASDFMDQLMVDNHLIQTAMHIFQNAEDKASKEAQEIEKQAQAFKNKLVNPLISLNEVGNHLKTFKKYIAHDSKGKPTEFLEGEYSADFAILYYETLDEIRKIEATLGISPSQTEIETVELAKKKVWKEFITKNVEVITDDDGTTTYLPAARFINPNYNTIKNDPLYQFLIKLENLKDKALKEVSTNGEVKSLRQNLFGAEFIRIPSIEKRTAEKAVGLLSPRFYTRLKTWFNSMWMLNSDDIEFGDTNQDTYKAEEVLEGITVSNTRLNGEPLNNIPLFFRNLLGGVNSTREKHLDLLSYDLITSAVVDYNNVMNYVTRTEVAADISLLRTVVEEATLIKSKRDILKSSINKESNINAHLEIFENKVKEQLSAEELHSLDEEGNKQYIRTPVYPKTNRILTFLDSAIEHRLNNKTIIKPESKAGESIFKSLTFTRLFASVLYLSFNIIQGSVNGLHAFFARKRETESSEFDKGTFRKAQGIYMRDIYGAMVDIGRGTPQSKLNLFREMFGQDSSYSELTSKTKHTSIFSKLNFGNVAFMMQTFLGEYGMSVKPALSVAVSTKMKKNGQYVDKNGNVTTRDKAIHLYDALEKVKGADGIYRLQVKEGLTVEGTKDPLVKGGVTWTNLTTKMFKTNAQIAGMYNKTFASKFKRQWMFGSIFHFRDWMPRMIFLKWAGISKALTQNLKTINQEEKELEVLNEGIWTSLGVYLRASWMKRSFDIMRMIGREYEDNYNFKEGFFGAFHSQPQIRKDNITKFLNQEALLTAMTFTTGFLTAMLSHLPDDEEDEEDEVDRYLKDYIDDVADSYAEYLYATNKLELLKNKRYVDFIKEANPNIGNAEIKEAISNLEDRIKSTNDRLNMDKLDGLKFKQSQLTSIKGKFNFRSSTSSDKALDLFTGNYNSIKKAVKDNIKSNLKDYGDLNLKKANLEILKGITKRKEIQVVEPISLFKAAEGGSKGNAISQHENKQVKSTKIPYTNIQVENTKRFRQLTAGSLLVLTRVIQEMRQFDLIGISDGIIDNKRNMFDPIVKDPVKILQQPFIELAVMDKAVTIFDNMLGIDKKSEMFRSNEYGELEEIIGLEGDSKGDERLRKFLPFLNKRKMYSDDNYLNLQQKVIEGK